MTQFFQHPLSAAFPPMSDEDYSALKADLKVNGQRNPAVFVYEDDEARVLDGWHRVQACLDLGIQPRVTLFDGDDPVAFVISANLHRRHLTASQRAAAVVACSEWIPRNGRADPKAEPAAAMAQKAGVSPRVIERAKQVQKADPALAQQVVAGNIGLNKAVQQVQQKEKPDRAEKIVAQIPKQSDIEKLRAELAEKDAEIERLREALSDMTDAAEVLAGIEEGRDTIEMLKAAKQYARAIERTRDALQSENARLKNEVKALRRKYEQK